MSYSLFGETFFIKAPKFKPLGSFWSVLAEVSNPNRLNSKHIHYSVCLSSSPFLQMSVLLLAH